MTVGQIERVCRRQDTPVGVVVRNVADRCLTTAGGRGALAIDDGENIFDKSQDL
jgi:hypothetical protein